MSGIIGHKSLITFSEWLVLRVYAAIRQVTLGVSCRTGKWIHYLFNGTASYGPDKLRGSFTEFFKVTVIFSFSCLIGLEELLKAKAMV